MISPSSTLGEAHKGLQRLVSCSPPIPVLTTVGIHPYHVNEIVDDGSSVNSDTMDVKQRLEFSKTTLLSILKNPLYQPWMSAVGECGLDASEGFPTIDDQLPWFEFQIQVAQELQLPLFIHERLAFSDTMRLLENVTVPTIIHCFTGTREECKAYVDRGFFISLSGYILKTDEGSQEVRRCLEEGNLPLERLMIETDAPYMGFAGCRSLYLGYNEEYVSSLNSKKKKRLQQSIYPNVPSSLPQVLSAVTICLKVHDPSISRDQVAKTTTENSKSLFGFSTEAQSRVAN